jgi:predicted GIY-YIG superfamily endonuclease
MTEYRFDLEPIKDLQGYFVYLMWDENDDAVYIGMSTNPYNRIKNHMARTWFGKLRTIDIIPCESEDDMRDLERAQIREHKPEFGEWFNNDSVNWSSEIDIRDRDNGRISRIRKTLSQENSRQLDNLTAIFGGYLGYAAGYTGGTFKGHAELVSCLIDHHLEPETGIKCFLCRTRSNHGDDRGVVISGWRDITVLPATERESIATLTTETLNERIDRFMSYKGPV